MSLTVRHLNADCTFLLIFSPEAHPQPVHLTAAGGAFTVLIDPWLAGPSIVAAPWFARTEHTTPSAIGHLAELDEPDVVVVSQNKPDHCHRDTLLQLRPDGKTVIAAEPGAAKAIKSWNHFDPTRVHGLHKYDAKVPGGRALRLPIPPRSPGGWPGEVHIAFLPAKAYLTGLHNAFGITYQPPTHTRSVAPVATRDLPRSPHSPHAPRYFHVPLTPATLPPSSSPLLSPLPTRSLSFDQPTRDREDGLDHDAPLTHRGRPSSPSKVDRPRLSRASQTASSEVLPHPERRDSRPPPALASPQIEPFHFELDPALFAVLHTLPTPPASPRPSSSTMTSTMSGPMSTATSPATSIVPPLQHQHQPQRPHPRLSLGPLHPPPVSSASLPNLAAVTPARPQALSVIYSPHGVPLADLQPYVRTHLVPLSGALPLTLLLHSFDHAQNPWYLGGNILAGVEGGADIARALMARCWISAHDEVKDDQGLSVRALRVRRTPVDEVRRHLWAGEHGEWLRKTGWTCDVRNLPVGKPMVIGPSRDLCAGMEARRESRMLKLGLDDEPSHAHGGETPEVEDVSRK